ncbi:MAG: hypothetical protein ABI672_16090 [Vicinamibacteria bacterium]
MMSLGLPEFGSRGRPSTTPGLWRGLQIAGLLVLAYVIVIGVNEWMVAREEAASLDRARAETAQTQRAADDERRFFQKNPDLLVAASSVESSPEIVWKDIQSLTPPAVSIVGMKLDYLPEAPAKVDLSVVAANPEAYDRFLNALALSSLFSDIKPGSENRPGSVRATVTASHRPKVGAK